MATTVHEPPQIDRRRSPGQGHTGKGGWTNPSGGDLRLALQYSPPPSSTAIWVVLFAVTMMFAAFTSALVVRKGSSLDWQTFNLPYILYFNTLLLLASSVTLELARRRVSAFMEGLKSEAEGQPESPARWLYITLFLGLLFVAGQYVAWSQLRGHGLYLATNPSSSFFYVLTPKAIPASSWSDHPTPARAGSSTPWSAGTARSSRHGPERPATTSRSRATATG